MFPIAAGGHNGCKGKPPTPRSLRQVRAIMFVLCYGTSIRRRCMLPCTVVVRRRHMPAHKRVWRPSLPCGGHACRETTTLDNMADRSISICDAFDRNVRNLSREGVCRQTTNINNMSFRGGSMFYAGGHIFDKGLGLKRE